MQTFAVYDSKMNAYLQPFFATAPGVAIRHFTAAAMDPTHNFHQFAGDFTLFQLGEWDSSTAQFKNETPISLCNGLQAIANNEAEAQRNNTQENE